MATEHQHQYESTENEVLLKEIANGVPLPDDVTPLAIFRCSVCGHLDRLSVVSEVGLEWRPDVHHSIVRWLLAQET